MIETQWRQMNDRYDVSPDGYVRLREGSSAGPAGRLLLPCWAGGTAIYLIRADKDKAAALRGPASRQVPMAKLVRKVWGLEVNKLTRHTLQKLRAGIQAHNAECFPEIRNRKASGGGSSRSSADCMPCPWSTPGKLDAGALPPEIDTWNCAQMDPMTNRQQNGVWVDIGPRRGCPRKTVRMPA